jgi:hypothetical protein
VLSPSLLDAIIGRPIMDDKRFSRRITLQHPRP